MKFIYKSNVLLGNDNRVSYRRFGRTKLNDVQLFRKLLSYNQDPQTNGIHCTRQDDSRIPTLIRGFEELLVETV